MKQRVSSYNQPGTTVSTQGHYAPTTTPNSTSVPIVTPAATIKPEDLNTILSEFTKTILEAVNNRISHADHSHSRGPNTNCNFCDRSHYIRNCPIVLEYIKQGKCKRNIEGKIVLPSGVFVPREIPGTLLRDRVDE